MTRISTPAGMCLYPVVVWTATCQSAVHRLPHIERQGGTWPATRQRRGAQGSTLEQTGYARMGERSLIGELKLRCTE